MTARLGAFGVIMALVGAVCAAGGLSFSVVRNNTAARRFALRFIPYVLIGSLISVVAMQTALIRHDFSIAYVANNNARETPLLFTISGMWAALEGSILLWGFIIAMFLGIIWHRFRKRTDDPLVIWALVVMLGVCAFFYGMMAGPTNPFKGLDFPPLNGKGPNPLLQNHVLMAIHPPILYIGYVGFTVPFAFAISSLITGRLGEGWLLETRKWTLVAWGCLTLGIIFGGWWSYEVLGWGGYWGWDPVENASLLPWLTGTAFIHSVLVQERRGMLRVWNLSLVCATFALTIFGTFLTRSGVVQSVHAFSNSSIGAWLLGLFVVIVLLSVGLIGWRGERLRSPGSIDSPLSREGAFLANNILFGAFAFVVMLGTIFPLLIEVWNGDELSVGSPYFNSMSKPIGVTLLFLMAVAPILPWRKASAELLQTRLMWPVAAATVTIVVCVLTGLRGLYPLITFALGAMAAGSALRQLALAIRGARRAGRSPLSGFVGRANGGMVVHLGVVLCAVAIGASGAYSSSTELILKPGESGKVGKHTVKFLGAAPVETLGDRTITRLRVQTDGGRVDAPALTKFIATGQPILTPSVRTGLTNDLYYRIVRLPNDQRPEAVFEVKIEPLILWLWVGGFVMAFGTALSIVPGKRRRATAPSSVSSAGDEDALLADVAASEMSASGVSA
jgi:cytochrome c-type biogenesis protein CcmF